MAYKGWLIYDEAGIKRNKWFAEQILRCARRLGLEVELKVLPTEGVEWRQAGAESRENVLRCMVSEWEKNTAPDFAIVRVIAPELSRMLEEKGVRLFNNARTAHIANNKWLTYEKALQWGIPVLETSLAGNTPAYPCVIKAVSGHGGSQVYWAEDHLQQEKILQELLAQGLRAEEIILQQPCSEPGRDMRVYVLGGKIYQAVLRSSSQDFRSNFSLGGKIELTEPDAEQCLMIERLHQRLQFDFAGIDFIPHNGKWILNEIEDVVGTRMLYQLTDRDVVQDYLTYIRGQLDMCLKK